MAEFKCLYSFTSPTVNVIEIKRTDLNENASISEVYKWLLIHSDSGKVFEFDFRSMGDGVREFVEGKLNFSSTHAQLMLLNQEFSLKASAPSHTDLGLIKGYLALKKIGNDICSLRPLKPSDVNFFKLWVFDQEVIRYSMTKFHRMIDERDAVDWFRSTLFDKKVFQWGLTDPQSGDLIGYAGISALNEIDKNGEFFIFIGNKSYWGKGIASFVTKEVVRMSFDQLNLHRIFLTASSHNPGAVKAYEKAGFIHEGRMREAFYRNGEYSDKLIMGILRSN